MKGFLTTQQVETMLASKAPAATPADELKLATAWINEVGSLSDAKARITAKCEAAASTGYVVDGKRYYINRVGSMAHRVIDQIKRVKS